MKISYNGKGYCGWQKQINKKTIQGTIELALKNILNQDVEIFASGRTDTDVSAICQMAHFDVDGVIPKGLVGHLNSILPDSIRINDISLAKDGFHARYNAKLKTYRYYFYVGKFANSYYENFAYHVKYQLDDSAMQKSIKCLIGEHNFTSFCSVDTDVQNKVRTIKSAKLIKDKDLYVFEITGEGFLYNMVRIIVGTLVDIGRGKIKDDIKDIILKENRTFAGVTMPAKGLVLYNVEY
jgi:tRNA pseudouridine38-40 synthase